nr:MAG: hypothetical protein [Bacteriophage sp.]
MKIINSIMPMNDIEALAANGQKLRVAVTKTSAQGKVAQSTTPNLMSFSTDENSVWFNGKKYGATLFKDLFGLSTGSSNEEIKTALGGNTYNDISQMVDRGILFLNINNKVLQHVMIRIQNTGSSEGDYLHIRGLSDASDTAYIKIRHYNGTFSIPSDVKRDNLLFKSGIVNVLDSSASDLPLSAAMGKKLQDEKLAKTDVVNNLTTTDTSKALSAAQGKVLNDKFNENKINIKFSATSNSADNATIKGYMGNIDGATLVNKLNCGANLVDSSSDDGDWVITLQEVSATKVSFTGIRFTDYNLYIRNVSVTISGSNYTNMTITQSNRFIPAINNTLTSTSTSDALSAAQGKALNDRISGLGNVYRVKGTKANLSDVLVLTDAKVGDVWNVTNAFTLGGKPYPANTNVVCITAASPSSHGEGNWDPLGGTVDLSTYVPKSDIVDNLSTPDSKKPLSAKQGLALATMITELKDNMETYQLLKTLESGTLSAQSEIDAILGPYSSFNAALSAGKVIHGAYKDNVNRMNTVAFSAFNDTTNSRVRMFAILGNSTLLYIQATYSGTNWTSATTSEESLSASITIE